MDQQNRTIYPPMLELLFRLGAHANHLFSKHPLGTKKMW